MTDADDKSFYGRGALMWVIFAFIVGRLLSMVLWPMVGGQKDGH